jgi:hypothetical protein
MTTVRGQHALCGTFRGPSALCCVCSYTNANTPKDRADIHAIVQRTDMRVNACMRIRKLTTTCMHRVSVDDKLCTGKSLPQLALALLGPAGPSSISFPSVKTILPPSFVGVHPRLPFPSCACSDRTVSIFHTICFFKTGTNVKLLFRRRQKGNMPNHYFSVTLTRDRLPG